MTSCSESTWKISNKQFHSVLNKAQTHQESEMQMKQLWTLHTEKIFCHRLHCSTLDEVKYCKFKAAFQKKLPRNAAPTPDN